MVTAYAEAMVNGVNRKEIHHLRTMYGINNRSIFLLVFLRAHLLLF